MPLTAEEAIESAKALLQFRAGEQERLDKISQYLRDDEGVKLRALPSGVPPEVHDLARVSRVNMLKFVVNSRVQSMYVDGFRAPKSSDDMAAWDVWQRNRFDSRQIGVHRAALNYGVAYVTVLPGDTGPMIRAVSPRKMTALYEGDDDWPVMALEFRSGNDKSASYRLIDNEAVYWLEVSEKGASFSGPELEFVEMEIHGARFEGEAVTPVVRYRDTEDLDSEVLGVVEPLIPLQDQIDITTFGLLVAQHFGAFRQRYILGWTAENEIDRLKASASRLWTFDDAPQDIQVGEFQQTDVRGYIESREATLKHLATVSQTPVHELLGNLINLSADALAAAEKSHQRAVAENRSVIGEAHEQVLALAGEMIGQPVDPMAEVVWRDTESRSLSQSADALGKLVQMLGVPAEELWEKIPGSTQQEIERWKATAEKRRAEIEKEEPRNAPPTEETPENTP